MSNAARRDAPPGDCVSHHGSRGLGRCPESAQFLLRRPAAVDDRAVPVTNDEASEARNTAAPAISCSSPQRPIGIFCDEGLVLGRIVQELAVHLGGEGSGQMALTVTPLSRPLEGQDAREVDARRPWTPRTARGRAARRR